MMQELIWYIQCYGPWVSAGFCLGVLVCTVMVTHGTRSK